MYNQIFFLSRFRSYNILVSQFDYIDFSLLKFNKHFPIKIESKLLINNTKNNFCLLLALLNSEWNTGQRAQFNTKLNSLNLISYIFKIDLCKCNSWVFLDNCLNYIFLNKKLSLSFSKKSFTMFIEFNSQNHFQANILMLSALLALYQNQRNNFSTTIQFYKKSMNFSNNLFVNLYLISPQN